MGVRRLEEIFSREPADIPHSVGDSVLKICLTPIWRDSIINDAGYSSLVTDVAHTHGTGVQIPPPLPS